jgi:colicin import membrane protein
MRFSTLSVLALIATGASAFGPSTADNRFAVRNIVIRESQSLQVAQSFHAATALRMADGNKSDPAPKKKTKKEELLEEIETSVRKAEARRAGLEAELALAEAERKLLLEEAERAAAIPDFAEGGVSAGGIATGLAAGGLAAAVAARSGLEGRSKKVEEERRKAAIAKAAAEQDAKNRAAAEARAAATKSSVSFIL